MPSSLPIVVRQGRGLLHAWKEAMTMMDTSYHGYDWILEDLPFDSEEAEETYDLQKPLELAQNNMKQWIRDIELGPVYGFSALHMTQQIEEPPKGPRYHFYVTGHYRLRDWRWPKRIEVDCQVWMPGVPIREVRCMDPEANPWEHMQVIYNDNPATWLDSIWDFVHDCEDLASRSEPTEPET